MAWRIGELTLDPQRAELCGAAGPIHVERYTLEVLIYLVRNSDRAVSRDELLDAVWGGRIVSDATISTQIKHARKAIGDTGAAQELIRTIHSRGFRFVGEATPIVP
ncbi:MAG: winged helix-turn-helix domain-containing protein, partial [Pseudomonadota bacterium]